MACFCHDLYFEALSSLSSEEGMREELKTG